MDKKINASDQLAFVPARCLRRGEDIVAYLTQVVAWRRSAFI